MVAENIDQAIALVYAKVDFVKKEHSSKLGYSFAGESAIIEVVRPAMVENGIIMRVLEIPEFRTDSFTSKSGTTMNQTILRARIRFTHAPSGTYVDCEALGEGMDSGDKSAPKAMTGAYKYAIRQTFMIETGDDPDKDSSDEQERSSPRKGGSVRSDGRGGGPLAATEPPPWYALFRAAIQEAGLVVKDMEPVIQKPLTPDTFRHEISAWLASDPAHSIEGLVSQAADMKAAVTA